MGKGKGEDVGGGEQSWKRKPSDPTESAEERKGERVYSVSRGGLYVTGTGHQVISSQWGGANKRLGLNSISRLISPKIANPNVARSGSGSGVRAAGFFSREFDSTKNLAVRLIQI